MQGYIQIYTGNGKGKTTAALGQAIRAVGAGKKVFFAQFVKGQPYSELEALKRFPEINIKQYGLGCFIEKEPSENDINAAEKGLKEVAETVLNNQYDLVIMDEIFIALYYKLINLADLKKIIDQKPKQMEIIMTGRYAPPTMLEIANLVTEMKEIKHYFNNGIMARKRI
ncbi:MAG: cob(I)yrinic acid a,c-diamide adenosyltransferase [Bacteroidales bacterium]|nr:cob(I)yrinic acid a,c-diamide adenosyltransferase [Bacteroidales bacterium]